jgi:trk system potassium uptake protein TrkA
VFVLIVGGGKVGANLTRALDEMGHEVVVIEQSRRRFDRLEREFAHRALLGDGTELFVLERAGIKRPPEIVVAATGDDEDNIVICQMARERYGVPKVVARVNDPRNQRHFDLLGIAPTLCATNLMLALIEHEVPEHRVVPLLELKTEKLEIVEIEIDEGAAAVGRLVEEVEVPEAARLISVVRGGRALISLRELRLKPGDQVIAMLEPGGEDALRRALVEGPRQLFHPG